MKKIKMDDVSDLYPSKGEKINSEETEHACWLYTKRDSKGKILGFSKEIFTEWCFNCPVFVRQRKRASSRRFADKVVMQALEYVVEGLKSYQRELDYSIDRLQTKDLQLSFLGQTTAILESSTDINEIFSAILSGITAGQALGFNRAFLFLVDEDEQTLRGIRAIGPSDEQEAYRIWRELEAKSLSLIQIMETSTRAARESGISLNNLIKKIALPLDPEGGVLAMSVLEKRTFNIIGVSSPVPDNQSLWAENFAVVPLLIYGKALGAIVVDNKFTRNPITDRDISLLETFAIQGSIAIENARLRNKLQIHVEELELAHRELQRHQTRLVQAEKMASLGEMAAHLAHEVKNPLTSIGGFANLVRKSSKESDQNYEYLSIIIDEVKRLENLLLSVLNFARPAEPNLELLDLNDSIEKLLPIINDAVRGSEITVRTSLDYTLPPIWCDQDQLRQVLLNVVQNAIHAMPDGGQLHLTSKFKSSYAQVEISDTGIGIPKEDIEKVFLPFFTTKEKGSGLGLSITHAIINNHQGFIDVISEIGMGTTFILNFPLKVQK